MGTESRGVALLLAAFAIGIAWRALTPAQAPAVVVVPAPAQAPPQRVLLAPAAIDATLAQHSTVMEREAALAGGREVSIDTQTHAVIRVGPAGPAHADQPVSEEAHKALMARLDTRMTPLMDAARAGDAAQVQQLLKTAPGDLNVHDRYGNTALMYASRAHHITAVQYLLDAGADPRMRNEQGANAWFWTLVDAETAPPAAEDQRVAILDQLRGHGADVNDADANGATLLHRAASLDDLPVVEFLLAHDANLEARDHQGRTPL
ncbi:MAG TPA: ankyrin repeat domain-containing protein, partial [Nevskiaceae bacterium]|nr:ankyrin repeat domain-containing protein [Nevskiaceae bacterium]